MKLHNLEFKMPTAWELTLPFIMKVIHPDKAVEKTGFGKFQLRLSILTGMAWMADAMEVGF